jgi:hypothetical protein
MAVTPFHNGYHGQVTADFYFGTVVKLEVYRQQSSPPLA